MQKYVIAARSINGVVYLRRNRRSWTDERTQAFQYAKYKTVLRRAIEKYHTILFDIHAIAVKEKEEKTV